MDAVIHGKKLVLILQAAYSGEMAAAFAYRGHWRSVRALDEIRGIRRIEREEWVHRRAVGSMLVELGAKPAFFREILFWLVGRTVGLLCHVTGWFFPMYLAGRLEHGNVEEYDAAALHANRLGMDGMARELRGMTTTERAHEAFFMEKIIGHPLLPFAHFLFRWGPDRGEGGAEWIHALD